MSNKSPNVNIGGSKIAGLKRFSHQAMATTFEIFIVHDDKDCAQQAAIAAFEELDKIEAEFSRFIDNSDVSRINHLAANQPLVVGLDTFECLKLCKRMHKETNGAFDVTVGMLMDCWFAKDRTMRKPTKAELDAARQNCGLDLIELDENNHTVKLKAAPMKIDLGGIGKGYAIDKMGRILRDWDIVTALLHSGSSSVLAIGSPEGKKGWPLTISNPLNHKEILTSFSLKDGAVGASGVQKGRHIIDPRSGKPIEGKLAAWSSADTAGIADALSTAFMILSGQEIENYCKKQPKVSAFVILEHKTAQIPSDKLLKFGQTF